ncbi:MAG: hypothetical protein CSA15_12810 [Candidatus Delongbacteria bacterium]|nr:MAG: hypothetical protein CSA15_12810 [Candidatus Delongbacteria bacterium]
MKKLLITTAIAILILLTSCSKKSKETKSKSIDQIQSENGIPVVVSDINSGELIAWTDYTTYLKGAKQQKVYGMLGDDLKSIDVKTGDIVKSGDVVAKFATDNPKAQYRQAKIQAETIEKTYSRMKAVFESGGISRQKMDEIEAKYKAAKETYLMASKLVNIKAPISGMVTDIFVDPGQRVKPSTPILEIAKTDEVIAKIVLEESKIQYVNIGDEVRVKSDSYDKEFIGKVKKVSLSANIRTGGFTVEIAIPNKESKLRPGLFCKVLFKTVDIKDVISIPRNSIVKIGKRKFVYIVEDKKAKRVEVETGLTSGDSVVIKSGLSNGDKLVVQGQSRLSDGSKVKIVS